MNFREIKEQFINSVRNISKTDLRLNFEKEINDTFLKISKIKKHDQIENYLLERFYEMKTIDFGEVNYSFREEYSSLRFLFNLFLRKEVRIKNGKNKELEIHEMQDENYYKLVSVVIDLAKPPDNNYNLKNERPDDWLDDEQDNFFYLSDMDDIHDNYDGLEFDNFE